MRWDLCAGLLLGVLVSAPVSGKEAENVEALVNQMDAVWQRRDTSGAIPDLATLGELAHTIDPDSYEVEWRMARGYFWVAYTQGNRVAKKAMAGKAIEAADRARRMRPDRVEGHYFYAISVGESSPTIGIMQAVTDGIAGKFETAATRAYEIDRDYYHGAPPTVLGRYYFMLPWPKRDLELSRRYLEEAVARHPNALIARDYLAETYYELDQREKAREQLAFVLNNDAPPGTELDRPAPKQLAREAMRRWFSQ
jgi:tetratricopeptide (TPR) repeat protein